MSLNKRFLLSPQQKRLFQFNNQAGNLFQHLAIKIDGDLDTKLLSKSVLSVVSRHDILRTSYVFLKDFTLPVQNVHEESDFVFLIEKESFAEASGKLKSQVAEEDHILFSHNNVHTPRPLFIKLSRNSTEELCLELSMPVVSADSNSLLKIVREIFAKYHGEGETQVEQTVQYSHFSEWQSSLLTSSEKDDIDFWKNYNFKEFNDISLSFQRNLDDYHPQTNDICVFGYTLDADTFKRLKILASKENFPLQDFLLTCFGILVQSHVNQEKLTMGYVTSGRSYPELYDTLGLMSKAIPLVIEFDPKLSFMELVQRIKHEMTNTLEWEEYFEWDNQANDLSAADNTFFKLGFEHLLISAAEFTNINYSLSELRSYTDLFNLKLTCLESGDNLKLDFYYNSKLFPSDCIEILWQQLNSIILKSIQNTDQAIDSINSGDSHFIAESLSFNYGKKLQVPQKSVIEIFEQVVSIYPAEVAIKFQGFELSYSGLNQKANQLANYLKSEGLASGRTSVAIMLPRSDQCIIAILAVLKIGTSYVPVDKSWPVERVKSMLDDSEVGAVITDTKVEAISQRQIIINEALFLNTQSVNNLCVYPQVFDPVYIIYTSGSSGSPKGVKISNASLGNYVYWLSQEYKIGPHRRTLLLSSIAFDLSYTSLWTSLLTGGSLSIMPETGHLEPSEISDLLIKDNIDYVKLTPSHFNIIINEPEFETNVRSYNLSLVILGGEAIVAKDLEKYFLFNKEVTFVNHYGPTEATIGTIAETITHTNFQSFRQKAVIGKPIANSEVYILDKRLSKCSIGITGEICIGGDGLALGYVNFTLDANKFIESPFDPGNRIYKTGDLGRWMPDGKIEFLGREDTQVKLRGYRIEMSEIELEILKFDAIKQAVILLKKDDNGEPSLIAYLITEHKAVLDKSKLVLFLKMSLPAYMIPSSFICLDSLPLTANGKIDRGILRTYKDENILDESMYVAPQSVLEKRLVIIWKDILGKQKIGLKDNFFDLGGHSLKATQLVSRVFKDLDFRIKHRDIFENPTIEKLITQLVKTGQINYKPIPLIAECHFYDASHAQKRLWVLDQFEVEQEAYNMHSAYWIEGNFNTAAFNYALEAVIVRHESLRTKFVVIDGSLKQKIDAYISLENYINSIDFRNQDDPEECARNLSKAELNFVFNLNTGPLLRVSLAQLRDNKYSFMLTMHHIISDGWSLRILFNELISIYNQKAMGLESFLRPLRIQYKDFAAWHENEILASEKEYWFKELNNPPSLVNLPYDTVGISDSENLKYKEVVLDKSTTDALKIVAKKNNSTLSSIVLTIYSLLIHKISGQDDFLIGVGHANRNHPDTEELIGFFVNLLPVRIRFSEDLTIHDLIADVTRTCLNAVEHSNYPFDLLVEQFCKERYSTRQPLLNVMYDFKNYSDILLDNEGNIDESVLKVEAMPTLTSISKFDITLFVKEANNTIGFYLEFDNTRFSSKTIDGLYKHFNELLSLFLAESEPVALKKQEANL